MFIYRVDYFAMGEHEQATEWVSSLRAANKLARENRNGDYQPKVTRYEVAPTRTEILALLNEVCYTHPEAALPWS